MYNLRFKYLINLIWRCVRSENLWVLCWILGEIVALFLSKETTRQLVALAENMAVFAAFGMTSWKFPPVWSSSCSIRQSPVRWNRRKNLFISYGKQSLGVVIKMPDRVQNTENPTRNFEESVAIIFKEYSKNIIADFIKSRGHYVIYRIKHEILLCS